MSIIEKLTAWIPQVQGKYINVDGAYGAQCWDLAAHWSAFLGLPVINTGGAGRWPGWAGNMVDAFPQSAEIAAAYTLHGPDETGQAGDIVVWGDSYWYYPATHVAVLYADKGPQLQCMSQNSTPSRADNPYPNASSGPTTIQSLPRTGLIGFIRPRIGGINYSGTITPIQEDDVSAAEVFTQKLTLKNGKESDFQNQVITDSANLDALIASNARIEEALGIIKAENREDLENGYKTFWNSEESKIRLQSAPPAEIALQINAAGIAADVRDELVKLLGGN